MNSFQNPLILLFIVSAIGYLVGRVKIFGSSIGISAILFVGLFIGAFDTNNHIPVIIFELGLVLFVYSLGVNSGKVFFQSIKNNGLRDITFVVSTLTVSVLIALLIYYLFDLTPELITGIYTGTTTNTPALAGVIQMIRENNVSDLNEITQSLTIGYTFSYPIGILGVIIALKLMSKLLKIDYKKEFNELKKIYPLEDSLSSKSVKITNPEIGGKNLREITNQNKFNILYGRICKPNSKPQLTNWETIVNLNDDLMIIGSEEELERVTKILGEESESNISYDRKLYDVKTIFISNPKIIGREISSLNLNQNYDATITRIRRGDVDLLAKPNLILELGDRIRFVAKRSDLKDLSILFGDSYNNVSQINIVSLGIGISLGLLLGSINFNFFNISFKFGIAGGPLIVGLIFGAIGRTGSINWTLPFGVSTTINQFGLILLLAVIGINSGNAFITNIDNGVWFLAMSAGAIISITSTIISVLIGYKLFKIPYSLLLGFLSNQPAILDLSKEMTQNRIPLISYSIMFPVALILKVLFAQILYSILI
jgi:putative transport protein